MGILLVRVDIKWKKKGKIVRNDVSYDVVIVIDELGFLISC